MSEELKRLTERVVADYWTTDRLILNAAADLRERGVPVDYLTLGDELGRRGQLRIIGGLEKLFRYCDTNPELR